MKIGVVADESDRRFSSTYESLPGEAVLYDVALPVQVKRALEIVSEHMPSRKGKTPLANQTEQAHHGDYGLVFRIGESESVELLPGTCSTDFTKGIVVARISMGMPQTTERIGAEEIVLKDPSKLARLHLNVYGARNFLPTNEITGQEQTSFGYASECVHFSLRWVDGKFDNSWNDAAKWLSEKDSQYMNRIKFGSTRTTYCESNAHSHHVNGNFYRDLSGWIPPEVVQKIKRGAKILTLKDIEEMVGPRKEGLLPANISAEEFLKLFPKGTQEEDARKASGYELRERKNFPNIGYSSVLERLSLFGNVSAGDVAGISEMNMDEGTEYIFGRVLPAVKKFAQA